MKKISYIALILSMFLGNSCSQDYLTVLPEDKITTGTFWQDENDVKLALNGIYSILKARFVYGYGPGNDAMTPNGFQWTTWEGEHQYLGNGSLTSSTTYVVVRWKTLYTMIYNANYFLEGIEKVSLPEATKNMYIGEARFLRGVAYSLLVDEYGGVPLVTKILTPGEAKSLTRSSAEDSWAQVIADYDYAIANLSTTAPEQGRADKGAALGMKMRALLWQNKYNEVLSVIDQIDALGKYSLFPSYSGLFKEENEHNQEVLFNVEFMEGTQGQGSWFNDYFKCGTIPSDVDPYVGANSVAPTTDLVNAYGTIDGSPIDPLNPYNNRDQRLDLSIVRPGSYFEGLLYPDQVRNHNRQLCPFSLRKYVDDKPVVWLQAGTNYIVLRYADVLLAKAEALIETNHVSEGVAIINRIRTERSDVKVYALSAGMSQNEARQQLRHERRIEFAFEGTYWADIRRWNMGPDIYPVVIYDGSGGIIETKFPNGYTSKYNLLPIPDDEFQFYDNLGSQNPGWGASN